jgi:hypothetical protein
MIDMIGSEPTSTSWQTEIPKKSRIGLEIGFTQIKQIANDINNKKQIIVGIDGINSNDGKRGGGGAPRENNGDDTSTSFDQTSSSS